MLQNLDKRAARRAFPIHGYCGANGGGKSAAMVWDTLPSLEAGRPVLSTVRLLDYANPRPCAGCDDPNHDRPTYGPLRLVDDVDLVEDLLPAGADVVAAADGRLIGYREVVGWDVHRQAHPLWVPFTEWEQLLDARACDVLMDEVTGVASSRESMGLPAAVANKLVQLRRADVTVRWSSPAWARADKIIRETSQSVTYAVGYLTTSKGRGADEGRIWRQRRLFRWRTYDAAAFEDFTAGKREQLAAEVNDWHWGPSSPAFQAYDTYDAVSVIGTVSETGTCYRCGGTRRRHQCKCDPASGGASPDRAGGGSRAAKRAGAPVAEPVAHDCDEHPALMT